MLFSLLSMYPEANIENRHEIEIYKRWCKQIMRLPFVPFDDIEQASKLVLETNKPTTGCERIVIEYITLKPCFLSHGTKLSASYMPLGQTAF